MYSDSQLWHMADKTDTDITDILCKDQLPNKIPRNASYIINMQSSKDCLTGEENSGTHWVALFMENGEGYYFDPFGFEPPTEVSDKLGKYLYSTQEIQSINSYYCGLYSLCFLWWMQHETIGFPDNKRLNPSTRMSFYLARFSPRPQDNLKIIKKLYKILIS